MKKLLVLLLLICLNYVFLSTSIWIWAPDLFIVFSLFLSTMRFKLPNVYIFIFYGFIIDLFFSSQSLPYMITFFLIGLYLNLTKIKWIQRTLFEQSFMIFLISLFLNLLLNFTNDYYLNISLRIIVNPILNTLIWIGIFMTQRHKWLKNI